MSPLSFGPGLGTRCFLLLLLLFPLLRGQPLSTRTVVGRLRNSVLLAAPTNFRDVDKAHATGIAGDADSRSMLVPVVTFRDLERLTLSARTGLQWPHPILFPAHVYLLSAAGDLSDHRLAGSR